MKATTKTIFGHQLPSWSWRNAIICGGLFFLISSIIFFTEVFLSFFKILDFESGRTVFLILYLIAPALGWYFFFYRYRLPVKKIIGKINLFLLIPVIIVNSIISLFLLYQSKAAEIILIPILVEFSNYQAKIDLTEILEIIESVLIVPAIEEFLFRGIILIFLTVKFGWLIGLLGSSILFGLMHHSFYGSLFTALLSGLMYLKTKSLINSILLHLSNNLLAQSISLFPYWFAKITFALGSRLPYLPILGENPLEPLLKLIIK